MDKKKRQEDLFILDQQKKIKDTKHYIQPTFSPDLFITLKLKKIKDAK